MEILVIDGATRTIGESQGYLGLPLRDVLINDSVTGPDTPAMLTAWRPDAAELLRLNAGHAITLCVVGKGHPPVMLSVDDGAPAGDGPHYRGQPVSLGYTNHRSEHAVRTIAPLYLWYGATEWHAVPQYLLKAFDVERRVERDFALSGFGPAYPLAAAELIECVQDVISLMEVFFSGEGDEAETVITKLKAILAKAGA